MTTYVTSGLSAGENRRIGRAMSDYSMLADGDTVLVAVSGGIDSLVLAWMLHNWRNKAPINYRLKAVHIDMMPGVGEAGINARQAAGRLETIGLSCVILPADLPRPTATDTPASSTKDVCFHCARSRRKQLFEYARKHHYSSIALGHHRDDIVETFFLNLTCGGNISTMRPRQDLFSGRLTLIRPLAYLRKIEITAISRRLGLDPVNSNCPLFGQTRRKEIRELLDHIYDSIPGSREHIFAALGNVRTDYLLKPSGNS
ncbi:MAG: ATP-binding protein [Thermodesulfobacteriota bacterium]|nr:ATP-binding protein [Thermodesulfobacteriota bacterium]